MRHGTSFERRNTKSQAAYFPHQNYDPIPGGRPQLTVARTTVTITSQPSQPVASTRGQPRNSQRLQDLPTRVAVSTTASSATSAATQSLFQSQAPRDKPAQSQQDQRSVVPLNQQLQQLSIVQNEPEFSYNEDDLRAESHPVRRSQTFTAASFYQSHPIYSGMWSERVCHFNLIYHFKIVH